MLGFFFGLEEDKITWHSNSRAWLVTYAGLEEDEITWFSNRNGSSVLRYKYKEIAGHSNSRDSVRRTTSGLEEDEITWYSNTPRLDRWPTDGLEEDEITWHSNQHCLQLVNRVGLA